MAAAAFVGERHVQAIATRIKLNPVCFRTTARACRLVSCVAPGARQRFTRNDEANLINYLWPLLIVLLSAPIAGERLQPWHLAGAALGLAGVLVLTLGTGELGFAGRYWPGYLAALGCAVVWSLYSVTNRRFGDVPTDAVAVFCAGSAALAALCHLALETTVWPATPGAWLAVLALGIAPVGAAFYLWDIGVKRGDIRALGALSYATPILSTTLLIIAGRARATPSLLLAAVLVVGGAALASRDLWWRAAGRTGGRQNGSKQS